MSKKHHDTPRPQGEGSGVRAPGRFAYEGLDRVIHEKARLSIVTSLATHPGGLIFNDLKDLCALTDGNLSRHLQILSEAGLIRRDTGTNAASTRAKPLFAAKRPEISGE